MALARPISNVCSVTHLSLTSAISGGADCAANGRDVDGSGRSLLAGYLFSSLGAFGVVSLMSSRTVARMLIPCSLTAVCSGIADPRGGDDGDDAVSGRYSDDLGFIGKFYVLAVGVQAHLWCWWAPWLSVRQSAFTTTCAWREPVPARPGTTGSRCTVKLAYSAGGIVVLISALLVLVLGVGHNR